ncbi:MAG: hypothetical protein ACJ76Z_10520, partial [Thermoleophilaceae bacterium]
MRRVGRLPAPVQLPAVAPQGNGALVIGGLDRADASSSSIVRIGSGGAAARQTGRLPAALHDAAAATLGSRTLFVGGGNAGSSSGAIMLVAPGGTTTRVGSLPTAASDVAAAALDGSVYVAGGYDGAKPLDTIVRVAPSGSGRVVAHMPLPLRYAAVASAGQRLLIAGGTSGTRATDAILSFDPATRRVRRIGRLPAPTTHAAAVTLGGHVFLIGGRGDAPDSQRDWTLAIDPATGRVRRAGHLPVALSDISAASLGDHALVVGGRDARGGVHDEIWSLTPAAAHTATASGRTDVYAAGRPGMLTAVTRRARALVYVPNSKSNTVDEISQRSGRIVRHFAVGALPQHVTPSWDLRTLYVTNDQGNSLTPIDPRTGKPRAPIPVTDPYNMYFTADGRYAIIVAEALKRLDFRNAHTMKLHRALQVPQCPGVDHMDYTADGRTAL